MGRIVQLSAGPGGQEFQSQALQTGPFAQSTQVSPVDVGNMLKVAEAVSKSQLPGLVLRPLGKAITWGAQNLKSATVEAPGTTPMGGPLTSDQVARQSAAQNAQGTMAEDRRDFDVPEVYDRRSAATTIGQDDVVPPPQVGDTPLADMPAGWRAQRRVSHWVSNDVALGEVLAQQQKIVDTAKAEYSDAMAQAQRMKVEHPEDVANLELAFSKANQAQLDADNAVGAMADIQAKRDAWSQQRPTESQVDLASRVAAITPSEVTPVDQAFQDASAARADLAYRDQHRSRSDRHNPDRVLPEAPAASTDPVGDLADTSGIPDDKVAEATDRLRYRIATEKDPDLRGQYDKTLAALEQRQEAIQQDQWAKANPEKADELAALESAQADLISRAIDARGRAKEFAPEGSNTAQFSQPGTLPVSAAGALPKAQVKALLAADKKTGGKVLDRLKVGMTPKMAEEYRALDARISALKGLQNPLAPPSETVAGAAQDQALPPAAASKDGGAWDPALGAFVTYGPKGTVTGAFDAKGTKMDKIPEAKYMPKASEVPMGAKTAVAVAYKSALDAGDTERVNDIIKMVNTMREADTLTRPRVSDDKFVIPDGLAYKELLPYATIADTQYKRALVRAALLKSPSDDYSLGSLLGGDQSKVEDQMKELAHFFPDDMAKTAKLYSEILHNAAVASKADADRLAIPRELAAKEMTAGAANTKAAIEREQRDEEIAVGKLGKGSFTLRKIQATEMAASHPNTVTVVSAGTKYGREGNVADRGEDTARGNHKDALNKQDAAEKDLADNAGYADIKLLTPQEIEHKADAAAAATDVDDADKAKVRQDTKEKLERDNRNARNYAAKAAVALGAAVRTREQKKKLDIAVEAARLFNNARDNGSPIKMADATKQAELNYEQSQKK